MDSQVGRKRNSKIAKNVDLKVIPAKLPKKDKPLESLTKAELIKKCNALNFTLDEMKETNGRNLKKIIALEYKIIEIEKSNKCESTNYTQTYPQNDVDFNCGVCIFQTEEEENLWKHMEDDHDVKGQKPTEYEVCSFCKEIFSQRSELMQHVKSIHEVKVKPCKYFQKGSCMFSDEICWYSHKTYQVTDETSKIEIKCKYCEKIFPSKSEMMKHRKVNHKQYVAPCRENSQNKCKYGEHCWFKHGKNDKENISNILNIE